MEDRGVRTVKPNYNYIIKGIVSAIRKIYYTKENENQVANRQKNDELSASCLDRLMVNIQMARRKLTE